MTKRRIAFLEVAFLEVDGTLKDSVERIAPSTIDAMRAPRADGHRARA